MNNADSFSELARYYDPIMSHVDYDRWFFVTRKIAELLPKPFRHLDTACGTGKLAKKLRTSGWRSVGSDLSYAMLHASRPRLPRLPAAQADLRALPFHRSLDYVTCLFDSVNFLLDCDSLSAAIREMGGALRENGILYFDIVTERMVLDHFAGQEWTERNGKISSTWSCDWHPGRALAETHIRINNGPAYTIREHIHTRDEVRAAVEAAGLELLGEFDAETWKAPTRKTVRIDYIAVRGGARGYAKPFKRIRNDIRNLVVR